MERSAFPPVVIGIHAPASVNICVAVSPGPDKPGFAQQAWSPAQRRHSYLLNDGCRNAAW